MYCFPPGWATMHIHNTSNFLTHISHMPARIHTHTHMHVHTHTHVQTSKYNRNTLYNYVVTSCQCNLSTQYFMIHTECSVYTGKHQHRVLKELTPCHPSITYTSTPQRKHHQWYSYMNSIAQRQIQLCPCTL